MLALAIPTFADQPDNLGCTAEEVSTQSEDGTR